MDGTAQLLQALANSNGERRERALNILLHNEQRPQDDVEPYRTLKEVAALINLHPATLWRWGVPGHHLGGRRRFKLSEVINYFDSSAFENKIRLLRKGRKQADSRKALNKHIIEAPSE